MPYDNSNINMKYKMMNSESTSDVIVTITNVTKTPQEKKHFGIPRPESWNSHREHRRGGISYF